MPLDTNLASMMSDLHKRMVEVVSNDPFPVCSNYKRCAINWLSGQFTEKIPEKEDANINYIQVLGYMYKTYQVTSSSGLTVTCLEETNKMGNSDSTTGLVTWQGAWGLLNFVNDNGPYILPPKAKILELGSGAGLFGLGLMKIMGDMVPSFIFSDENTKVLSSLVTNFNINFNKRAFSTNDLAQWLEVGPPPYDSNKSEVLPSEELKSRVQFKRLDWLDAPDELIASLDYNIVFGSDLTYTPALLKPLAQLLKRLLTAKSGQSIVAFIACTHRQMGSIDEFLEHLVNCGLHYTVAMRSTFSTKDGCVVDHEPLHRYSVFKVTKVAQTNIDS